MKKATILSLGAAVIVIAGIATMAATSAAKNRNDSFDYDITNFFDEDGDKESKYSDYITNEMASVIENNYEITSCKIDVSYSDGEIVSADIRVVTENDETNALETDISNYVSKALGISTEKRV